MVFFYLQKGHFARRIYQKGHIVSLRHLCETRQYITQSFFSFFRQSAFFFSQWRQNLIVR